MQWQLYVNQERWLLTRRKSDVWGLTDQAVAKNKHEDKDKDQGIEYFTPQHPYFRRKAPDH